MNELGWRRGVLVFDNTTLADAAIEFNRYNRQKLVIADPAAARLTIDGTFQTTDVRHLPMPRRTCSTARRDRGNEIVISR